MTAASARADLEQRLGALTAAARNALEDLDRTERAVQVVLLHRAIGGRAVRTLTGSPPITYVVNRYHVPEAGKLYGSAVIEVVDVAARVVRVFWSRDAAVSASAAITSNGGTRPPWFEAVKVLAGEDW